MNRVQLATLLSWANTEGLKGRKRLQKVVFFLQHAGCQLNCAYTLHHFGPYSLDVANACDEMVAAGLVEEVRESLTSVVQYLYRLNPHTRDLLAKTNTESMKPFESLGKELISQDLWSLELGSTILFFYNHNTDWSAALEEACKFKNVSTSEPKSQTAFKLAQRFKQSTVKL